jgi:hypothetical protein
LLHRKVLSLVLPEFHAVLHRHVREGILSLPDACDLSARFFDHAADGLWNFIPANEALLRRTSSLLLSASRDLFVRAGDAIHLTAAQESGEREVWTSDRHMLAAAPHFGLSGRSV